MNIKAALKYQLEDHKKSIIIFYITILFVYLIAITSIWSISTNVRVSGSFNGMNVATAIFLFVSGLCSFRENFLMLGQNGISRKTIFTSRVIVNIIVAIVMAIIDKFIWIIFKAIAGSSGSMEFKTLFEMVGGNGLNGMSNLLINLGDIGFSIVIYLACIFVGYFITIMFYRLNKAGQAIVGAGVPVFFLVVLPIFDSVVAGGRINRFFSKVVTFAVGTLDRFIISSIVISVVFAALSWLLMRRASEKK